jgi:hypothetical protein
MFSYFYSHATQMSIKCRDMYNSSSDLSSRVLESGSKSKCSCLYA